MIQSRLVFPKFLNGYIVYKFVNGIYLRERFVTYDDVVWC